MDAIYNNPLFNKKVNLYDNIRNLERRLPILHANERFLRTYGGEGRNHDLVETTTNIFNIEKLLKKLRHEINPKTAERRARRQEERAIREIKAKHKSVLEQLKSKAVEKKVHTDISLNWSHYDDESGNKIYYITSNNIDIFLRENIGIRQLPEFKDYVNKIVDMLDELYLSIKNIKINNEKDQLEAYDRYFLSELYRKYEYSRRHLFDKIYSDQINDIIGERIEDLKKHKIKKMKIHPSEMFAYVKFEDKRIDDIIPQSHRSIYSMKNSTTANIDKEQLIIGLFRTFIIERKRYVISTKIGRYMTMTNKSLESIMNFFAFKKNKQNMQLTGTGHETGGGNSVSDDVCEDMMEPDSTIIIEEFVPDDFVKAEVTFGDYEVDGHEVAVKGYHKKVKTRGGGSFFDMLNKTSINLERYGIFQEMNKKMEEKCLIYALSVQGLSKDKLDKLRLFCCNEAGFVKKMDLKAIANHVDIYISLKSKAKKQSLFYGNPKNDKFSIGLINKHYFSNDKETTVTPYAVHNYEKLSKEFENEIDDFRFIAGISKNGKYTYEKRKERFMESYHMIDYMFEHKDTFFKEFPNVGKLETYDHYKSERDTKILDIDLDYEIEKCARVNSYESSRRDLCCCNLKLIDGKKCGQCNGETTYKKGNRVLPCDKCKATKEECSRGLSFTITGKDGNKHGSCKAFNECKCKLVFFDYESYPDDKGYHQPYLLRFSIYDPKINKSSNIFEYHGPNCGKDFLNYLCEHDKCGEYILIAHNVTYDFSFLNKYLYNDQVVFKDKKLINGVFNYSTGYEKNKKTIRVCVRDSYALIPERLSTFGEMFGLEQEKEIMPYGIYNEKNLQKRYIDLDEILKCFNNITKSDSYVNLKKKQFTDNCIKWGLLKDHKVDIIEYSSIYCKIDVEVLMSGYNTFRKWILQDFGIDIIYYYTLASIADINLKKKGCYDGTYSLAGVPRYFIQKSVVGGRNMLRDNKKQHVIKKISDFDAVSLYPSAMNRIMGFLKGLPKPLPMQSLINMNNENILNYLNKYDGYFVEIMITHIGKRRHMPLMSYIDDDGIRNWNDGDDALGKILCVNKTALNDFVNFQQVKFTLIKGYYYDEGFNDKIKTVIREMFDKRVEYKNKKNPIQSLYKLLMNSSYGKSILKPIDCTVRLIHGEKNMKKFVYENFDYIKEFYKVHDSKKYYIKVNKTIMNHFNNCHIGSIILSESKRIMNEVICLAEDLGIEVYYTDTDSIHIEYDKLKLLEKKFKKKYSRDLIGENMGQFHNDFEIHDECGVMKDESGKKIKFKEVYSTELIAVGKKVYHDKLVGVKEDGSIVHGEHCRMKGIPTITIDYKSVMNNTSIQKIYKQLYNGEDVEMDLYCGGLNTLFRCDKGMSFYTIVNMNRRIQFEKNIEGDHLE